MEHRSLFIAAVSFAVGASLAAAAILLGGPDGGRDVRSSGHASTVGAGSLDAPLKRSLNAGASATQGEVTWERIDAGTTTDDVPLDAGVVEVELTGVKSHWLVRYRGASGTGRPGDPKPLGGDALRLPAQRDVRLRLRSRDYVYMLSLPQPQRTQMAVPQQEFDLDFRTGGPGVLVLQGNHLCGPGGPGLTIHVIVEPQATFAARLQHQAESGSAKGTQTR